MESFRKHRGLVATLDRANVDTDQIIPKQFLKRIERTGFGQFLFFDWRFREDGSDHPDFELNQPVVRGASVLVARRNFGSGSSREHAVWALADYGFRVVIAPSFADIFYNNCFKNGLLPIRLDEDMVQRLFERVAAEPGYQLTVDLEQSRVRDDGSIDVPFVVEEFRRHSLLEGLDDIALTLQHADKITAYEQAAGGRRKAEGGRRKAEGGRLKAEG
jgi:3-isopropylmalate/(R)-2-methylmalate dehydratase small subunit